ncbi:MAG: ABC transporter permease [Phycisphaerae bacterium]
MGLTLAYNWRNLWVRKFSTGLTFLVVAALVLVLTVLMSFAAGIQTALEVSGWPENVLVIRRGAQAESTSIMLPPEVARLVQTPGVARNAAGELLISQELAVQTDIPRRGAGNKANVCVRGVDPVAFEVHPEVRVVEGRMFEYGALEAVVGRAARDRYAGLNLGDEVILGRSKNRAYTVVGVFEARGGAFESEIWAPRMRITDSYHRNLISSVCLRMERPQLVAAALEYINGPAVALQARPEPEYYRELSASTAKLAGLALGLVLVMGVGAAFAVANTMYAAVDRRRREIAMLRTIGFSRPAIVSAFLTESILLCLIACAAGVLGGSALSGRREDYLSDATYTVFAYEMTVTGEIVVIAFALAGVIGLVGAFFPALRAARVEIIGALRKA